MLNKKRLTEEQNRLFEALSLIDGVTEGFWLIMDHGPKQKDWISLLKEKGNETLIR
jgi:hypothetical protein